LPRTLVAAGKRYLGIRSAPENLRSLVECPEKYFLEAIEMSVIRVCLDRNVSLRNSSPAAALDLDWSEFRNRAVLFHIGDREMIRVRGLFWNDPWSGTRRGSQFDADRARASLNAKLSMAFREYGTPETKCAPCVRIFSI